MSVPVEVDREILLLSLRKVSEAFDRFISACRKDGGPSGQDIAKARAYLPPYCENAYPRRR